MYVDGSGLAGWTDWLKATIQRAKKVQPIKVLAREVLPPAPPVSPQQYETAMGLPGKIPWVPIAIGAGLLFFMSRGRSKR